ncbi:Vacuolar protein sorting-associated protein 52 -like protein [Toxocara canis]|uniref:Vacuolar protein sorting-associated protein 52 homolog n=1 Tax=Toxocara canis TaxID=6265 RepID=A0A0B2V9B7_TOXCA|nr:Vacuolar protein sorting-associated protein 52 -like protein [Toxocara canis]
MFQGVPMSVLQSAAIRAELTSPDDEPTNEDEDYAESAAIRAELTSPDDEPTNEDEDYAEVDDKIVRDALESGMDLREYSAKLDDQLKTAHRLAVQDCIEQADKLAELHLELTACDDAFARLEEMLTGFQSELGTISSDMKRLSVLVILDREVGEREFLEQLHELQHKLQFLKAQEFKEAKAVADVQDVIENLKYKAMAKVREWLLMKISSFKKPLTNYQIPQGALLKNRFLYEFLLANDRQVAREVRDEYVDTISKIFFTYFKTYASRLFRLQLSDAATKDDQGMNRWSKEEWIDEMWQLSDAATKDDLLGAEDAVKATGFFSSKPQVRNRATVFSLGTRESLLSFDFLAPLIVPHAAQQANERFQFESLFRSVQYALVDHSSHEFLFLSDFFMVGGQAAIELFSQIMMRSITCLLKSCEERILANYDAISLYLCICLCTKYSELMVERGIPAMDGYWDTLTRMLWHRFDAVMQLHNESVRAVDVKKIVPPPDTRPHYIIRRYAEFTCALLVCSQMIRKQVEPKLQRHLSRQQSEVEQLLNRLSASLPNPSDRLVCIINNYDLILNILEAAFTQLVQYYHRFSKVLSHEVFAENAARKELVNIHHIMVELKKYKPVY